MTPAMLLLIPQLISIGIATIEQIRGLINTLNPGMTDVEMNALLDLLQQSAAKHQALANADRG